MTGFEARASGIGSDRSTNWATRLPPNWKVSTLNTVTDGISISLLYFEGAFHGLFFVFSVKNH